MAHPFRKKDVIRYMKAVARFHTDASTGEINMTTLAEDAARHFNQAHQGGPLDDEKHWIWAAALEVSDYLNRKPDGRK